MVRVCTACGQKNRVGAAHLALTVRCGKCKAPIGPVAEPIAADVALFEDVLEHARVPALVDFWADWCGPCRLAAPEVARAAAAMAGRALVLKVDTEQFPQLAARYDVRGIPNFIVLKGGRLVFQHAGLSDHTAMTGWLQEAGA